MALTVATQGIHTDQHLTQIARSYRNGRLIGADLAPIINVQRPSDKFRDYGKEGFNALEARADGAAYPHGESKFAEITYATEIFSEKEVVTDRAIANADDEWDLLGAATRRLADKALLTHEWKAAELFTTTGNYATSHTTSLSDGSRWDDANGGDPIEDLRAAESQVWTGSGGMANVLALDVTQAGWLFQHPLFEELYKYASLAGIAGRLPQKIRGMDVLVAGSRGRSSRAGQTDTFASIWGVNAIVAVIETGQEGLKFAATFMFRNMRTRRLRDEEVEGFKVLVDHEFQVRTVANDAAYLIQNTSG